MNYEQDQPAWLPVFSFLDNIPLPSCSAEWGEGVVMAVSDIDFTYTKPFFFFKMTEVLIEIITYHILVIVNFEYMYSVSHPSSSSPLCNMLPSILVDYLHIRPSLNYPCTVTPI